MGHFSPTSFCTSRKQTPSCRRRRRRPLPAALVWPIKLYSYAFLSSIGDRLHLPIGEGRDDSFLRGLKGRGRLLPELILGVDKGHVPQADEPKDVPKIGCLKIERLGQCPFLIATSASRDDNYLLRRQKPARSVGSI